MTTATRPTDAVAARMQALVDAEAAVEGAACILRVELPRRGLVWQHVAGGISAWRLWVQDSSPGWRVHYWLYPDNSVEFAGFVKHNDYSIAEPLRTFPPSPPK